MDWGGLGRQLETRSSELGTGQRPRGPQVESTGPHTPAPRGGTWMGTSPHTPVLRGAPGRHRPSHPGVLSQGLYVNVNILALHHKPRWPLDGDVSRLTGEKTDLR